MTTILFTSRSRYPNKLYSDFEYNNSVHSVVTKKINHSPEQYLHSQDNIENDLVQVVEYVINWQNSFNKERIMRFNEKRNYEQNEMSKEGDFSRLVMKSSISDIYDTLPQLLASGLRPLKKTINNYQTHPLLQVLFKSCNNSLDPLPYDMQYLLFVFFPSQYMARSVLDLNDSINILQKQSSKLQHKL